VSPNSDLHITCEVVLQYDFPESDFLKSDFPKSDFLKSDCSTTSSSRAAVRLERNGGSA